MTNSPDFKRCIPSSLSVVEMLFTNNIAYYVSLSIGALFAFVCCIMRHLRGLANDRQLNHNGHGHEKDADPLGQLSILQVLIKSGLPGVSFGSEIVLIVGIMYEMPPLAVVMLLFRLAHVVGTLFAVIALFGSASTKGYLTQHENTIIKLEKESS